MLGTLLGTTTPLYKGTAQPGTASAGGLVGLLSGLFGTAGTPAYAGTGQPATSGSSFSMFPQTPVYARPVVASSPDAAPPDAEQPILAPAPSPAPAPAPTESEPTGQNAEAPVRKTTLIVKPGPGTSMEDVVRFLQDRVLDD